MVTSDGLMRDRETDDLGRQLSGRWIVAGMFGFAVLLTAAMALYWHFYTLPFRELQSAINAEFPDSSPRAIGGREKGRSTEPMTLRVVVRTGFNPLLHADRSEAMAQRLFQLAREHADIDEYEVFEVHLCQRQPEEATRTWSRSRPIAEWLAAASE
jgi:hypothetical protein